MNKFLLTTAIIITFAFYAVNNKSLEIEPIAIVSGSTEINSSKEDENAPSTTKPNNNPVATKPVSAVNPVVKTNPVVVQEPPKTTSKGLYKDGQYTGTYVDAYYGFVQVQVVIEGGKLTDIIFLSYPNDRSTSREINARATVKLRAEAIQIQKASVDIVSGATETSFAFRESLGAALNQAKI